MEAPKSTKIDVDKNLYMYEELKSAGYVQYVSYWNSVTKVSLKLVKNMINFLIGQISRLYT